MKRSTRKKEKSLPVVVFTKYSPFMAVDLGHFRDHEGRILPVQPVTSLCRCGRSRSKPYCDGTHAQVGFVAEKKADRLPDRVKDYVGRAITIHDNRGVCSHDGACVRNLPAVFDTGKRPWINPDGAGVRKIIQTIKKCPSGALSYSIGKKRYQDLRRAPAVKVSKNGPYMLTGFVALKDDMGSKPESKEHCTLCRCGESSNRPFCDGTHRDINFDDSK
jgi:CDGSH-type Zn-finger protein